MEEEDLPRIVVDGTATFRGFESGSTFKLKDHFRSEFNVNYLITAISHSCDQGDNYRSSLARLFGGACGDLAETRQRLGQVVAQIRRILQPDREANDAVGDAEPRALLGADTHMRGRRRMRDERFRIAEIVGNRDQSETRSSPRNAPSLPPATSNVTTVPPPLICAMASACCG